MDFSDKFQQEDSNFEGEDASINVKPQNSK